MSYQWQQSADGTAWTDIPGAVNAAYQILAQTAKDNGWNQFRCVLTNTKGDTASNPASLTVVTVLYVRYSTISNPDGTSWDKAYPTLQSALSSTAAIPEIWVAAGTYKPDNNRSASFVLKANVAVYGGFSGSETFREARSILETFRAYAPTPYVVAANKQDKPDAWDLGDMRVALRLDPAIKLLPCVAKKKESVKKNLLELLFSIMAEMDKEGEER